MGSIIQTVLEINRDINLEYRTSKKPKFIKKYLANKRRSKLIKIIDQLHDLKTIGMDIIEEYINLVHLRYPPYGSYKSCKKIEPLPIASNKPVLSALFIIDINKNEIGSIALSPDNEENSFLIRFIWRKDGITKFANAKENVKVLNNTELYDRYSYPYSSAIENDIIKDLFCKNIMDDIYDFLMDEMNNSERLINYDRYDIE